jgi:hypothetical protein
MSLNLTLQQIFSWTAQLSAQQDYQALTHKFLDILAEIPWIESAEAYEIYNHERKKNRRNRYCSRTINQTISFGFHQK